MKDVELTTPRWKITSDWDQAFEARGWIAKIPFIKFPSNFLVQVIPPFSGATCRFRVRTHKMKTGHAISVYLDCYQVLGCWDEPYWEIYPDANGDNSRHSMNDIPSLIDDLKKAVRKAEREARSK